MLTVVYMCMIMYLYKIKQLYNFCFVENENRMIATRTSMILNAIKTYFIQAIIVMVIFFMYLLMKELFTNVPTVVSRNALMYDYNSSLFQNNISYKVFNSTTATVTSKRSSFFMSLSYSEQLTCGMRNLLSSGIVAQNLGAKVVIPFLLRSRLYGIPNVIASKEVPGIFYPLNILYDITQLNKTFHSLSDTYLVDFEDFLYNAPREIVMIDFIHQSTAPKEICLIPKSISKIYKIMKYYSVRIFNCGKHVFKHKQPLLESILLMLRTSARLLGVKEFLIKKYICIDISADVTTDEIKRFVGPKPRTVMFTQWRGCAYYSCDVKAPRNVSNSYRNKILYHSNRTIPKPKDIVLPLNDNIKLTALRYLRKIKLFAPFVSVHIRIEKLSRVNNKINGHTACCLEILKLLLKLLKSKYFNQTLLITDVGYYGSDACYDKVCLPHSRKVKGILKSMGLVRSGFNPKITNSSENPAFASLVEMHMLALGDRLVVVGQGSFKQQVIKNFLASNPTNKLYHICTEAGTVLNEFSNLKKDCWKDNG